MYHSRSEAVFFAFFRCVGFYVKGVHAAERQSGIMARMDSGTNPRRVRSLGLESLTFRYLAAVDVEGFSRRSTAQQARVQDVLELALAQAAESTGLERERWYRQPGGDGELAVLPQGVDGLSLVADYPRELASRLADVNRANGEPRLRLRMAIHHGAVAPGCFGPVGKALIAISRLVDAEAVRQRLRQHDDLDIALIVSAAVYDEVIQSRLRGLDPDDFRRVAVRAKGISYVGYLCEKNLDSPEPGVPVSREPILKLAALRITGPGQPPHSAGTARPSSSQSRIRSKVCGAGRRRSGSLAHRLKCGYFPDSAIRAR